MEQKHNYRIINRYSVSSLAVLVIAAAAFTMLVIKPGTSDAATPQKKAATAAVPSQFTFTGAADWYQGPTRKGDMALFHKIQDSCFVSVQHITGTTIAAHQAKKHKFDAQEAAGGHTVTPFAVQNMTLQTNTGVKQYQLQQTNTTNPAGASTANGSQLDEGNEEGYVPLGTNDFIYVEGHCETAAELAATIPALQAVTFDTGK